MAASASEGRKERAEAFSAAALGVFAARAKYQHPRPVLAAPTNAEALAVEKPGEGGVVWPNAVANAPSKNAGAKAIGDTRRDEQTPIGADCVPGSHPYVRRSEETGACKPSMAQKFSVAVS